MQLLKTTSASPHDIATAGADADDAGAATASEDAAVPSTSDRGVTAYGGVTEDAGARIGRTKKNSKAPIKAENHTRAGKAKKGSEPLLGRDSPCCTGCANGAGLCL